jgi:hypothetical protein
MDQQVEVASQFLVGITDKSERYCDDIKQIAAEKITSISGFWFDLCTSIPWSFFDFDAHKV